MLKVCSMIFAATFGVCTVLSIQANPHQTLMVFYAVAAIAAAILAAACIFEDC